MDFFDRSHIPAALEPSIGLALKTKASPHPQNGQIGTLSFRNPKAESTYLAVLGVGGALVLHTELWSYSAHWS